MELELKNKILSEIKFSDKDHKIRVEIANNFIQKLQKTADENKIKVEFFIGGSFGKNTYLKDSSDIDTFARFDKNYDDEKISEMLKEILEKTNIEFKKQKGSRDYYSVEFVEKNQNFLFEFVPNRKISSPESFVNTTDISPFHVEYLHKKGKENPEIYDEIRLAKRFFKSKKLYGAESYIGGFAGHVIDILIMHYKSLENLIKSAKDWKETTFIDINSAYKDEKDAIKKMDSAKISKLILVDSILLDRNAARALSDENYYKFLDVVNSINELSENDFKIKKQDLDKEITNHINYCVQNEFYSIIYDFKLDIINSSEDIVGSKLLKISKLIEKLFKKYDFGVFERNFLIDLKIGRCLFLYKIENKEVPKIKEITGPFVWMIDAAKKFKSSKKDIVIKNNRYYGRELREITSIEKLKNFTKEELETMLNKNIDFVKSIKIK